MKELIIQNTELIKKHWPVDQEISNQLVNKLAEIASLAELEEADIAELCAQLAEFQDTAFIKGFNLARRG
jgi:hypothetical protein